MKTAPSSASALNLVLRCAHRSVLAALAVCAVAIALGSGPETTADPQGVDRRFAAGAFALAAGAVLIRWVSPDPGRRPRVHVALHLTSLLLAGGLGPVAVALAWSLGPRETALLYTLAGALIALRPPPQLAIRAE